MARPTRTFIAVPVPENLGAKLTRLQSLLAPEVSEVRWVSTPPFHLTLAFLGDVDETDLNDVCRAVAEATKSLDPFDLRIEGIGAFPDLQRPRALWTGLVGPGLEPLAVLRASIAGAVTRLNYPPDKQFHPHVTLGRLKPGRTAVRDLTPLVKHYRTWSAGSFRLTEAVTYASTLTQDGPVYATLGTAPLRGGKPRPTD